MLTEDDVVWAYRICLDREPENAQVVKNHLKNCKNRRELARAFTTSEEFQQKVGGVGALPQSPFWHYLSAFDAIGTIKKYAGKHVRPSAGFATNFLGVRTRPAFYPKILTERTGTVDLPPIPANWHADIAEWASCLRSVDLAGDRFVMLELGCGWGCWMNNLGVAAKSVGKRVRLFGMDADQASLQSARLAFSDNAITEDEFTLVHGIAGKSGSVTLFPRVGAAEGGGGEAIFNPTSEQLRAALDSGDYVSIPVIDIDTLTRNEERLDFVHVDVQGAELDLLTEQFDVLSKKVRYVFVGTHSKQIEGGLFELFTTRGHWKLEVERPAVFGLNDGRPVVQIDGAQAWRNSAFA
jgi:FkbM family methyltransferase